MNGPLTKEELNEANELLIKRVKGEAQKAPAFEQQLQQLFKLLTMLDPCTVKGVRK